MEYIDLTQESVGITDYTALENLPEINSVTLTGNKSLNDLGLMSNPNYIGEKTTIEVGEDKQFAKVSEALLYLEGKWNTSYVFIRCFGVITEPSFFEAKLYEINIPCIYIGTWDTSQAGGIPTIKLGNTTDNSIMYIAPAVSNRLIFRNVILDGNDTTARGCGVVDVRTKSTVYFENVTIKNSTYGFQVLNGSIDVNNCTVTNDSLVSTTFAITANAGEISVNGTFNATNCTYLFSWLYGGRIINSNTIIQKTNVTNNYSGTKNQISQSGYCLSSY